MVERVVFGDVGGGQFALKVSKPSFSVLSATDKQLLLDTTRQNVQIIASGVMSGTSGNVAFPNFGFNLTPLLLSANNKPYFEFLSTSQIKIYRGTKQVTTDPDTPIYYYITTIPWV